ncbi:hypothetical protein D3C80_1943960 [compost metagenome]
MNDRSIEAAHRQGLLRNDMILRVKEQTDKMFLLQVTQLLSQNLCCVLRAADDDRLSEPGVRHPPAQLYASFQLHRLGRADAFDICQFFYTEVRKPAESA